MRPWAGAGPGGTPYSYALTFLIVTIIIATKYNVLKLMNSIRMLHFLAFYYNIVIWGYVDARTKYYEIPNVIIIYLENWLCNDKLIGLTFDTYHVGRRADLGSPRVSSARHDTPTTSSTCFFLKLTLCLSFVTLINIPFLVFCIVLLNKVLY